MSLRDYLKTEAPKEFKGRPLTCIPSDYDPRDFVYPRMLTAMGATVVDNGGDIDYRPNLPPVFDQKQRGSCVACSSAWGPKAYSEINEGGFPDGGLSAAYLYSRCKELDGNPNQEGTQPRVALQVLQKYGIPPESAMPYSTLTSLPIPLVPKVSALAEAQAGRYKISTYAQLASMLDKDRSSLVATIRQALLREGPVVVAGLVCSNFIPDENGVVPLPDGYIQGGHQYVFCGHLPEKKLFIMRNTWGKDWGIDGYAYMHEDWLFRASDMGYYTMEIWSQTDLIMPKRAKEIRIRPGFYSMLVDGVEIALDQPAFITNANRTVLPVRAIASNAGYLVSWDNDKSEVILTDPSQ